MFTYPAGHAFNRDVDADAYDADSARTARKRTLDFSPPRWRGDPAMSRHPPPTATNCTPTGHGHAPAGNAGPVRELRLMDDANYPWLVLVPRVADARELVDLDAAQRHQPTDEIDLAARVLRDAFHLQSSTSPRSATHGARSCTCT